MEVRSIITEALSRANVVPRRQPAPGDLVQSSYNLLKGIVGKYNNDNFLSFTQQKLDLPARKIIHIYGQHDTMLGEYNYVFNDTSEMTRYVPSVEDKQNDAFAVIKTNPKQVYGVVETMGAYHWEPIEVDAFDPRYQQILRYVDAYHVHLDGVSKLNTLAINRGQPCGMLEMHFEPYANFDSYCNTDLIWTFNDLSQGEWIIEVKPYLVAQNVKLRLDYNRAIEFDLDTDLRIPDAYTELLTVALTYKLAVAYPRMDDAQVARLATELEGMLNNVKTPKADAKQVLRGDGYDDRSSYWGVVGGRMWGF